MARTYVWARVWLSPFRVYGWVGFACMAELLSRVQPSPNPRVWLSHFSRVRLRPGPRWWRRRRWWCWLCWCCRLHCHTSLQCAFKQERIFPRMGVSNLMGVPNHHFLTLWFYKEIPVKKWWLTYSMNDLPEGKIVKPFFHWSTLTSWFWNSFVCVRADPRKK